MKKFLQYTVTIVVLFVMMTKPVFADENKEEIIISTMYAAYCIRGCDELIAELSEEEMKDFATTMMTVLKPYIFSLIEEDFLLRDKSKSFTSTIEDMFMRYAQEFLLYEKIADEEYQKDNGSQCRTYLQDTIARYEESGAPTGLLERILAFYENDGEM